MKVKLSELVKSEEALGELSTENLSARMSFTIARVIKEVGRHLEEKRNVHLKLLQKYGEKVDGQSGTFTIPHENRAEFESQFSELMETEVELVGIGRIKISAIEAEGVKFTPEEFIVLSWLFKEDVQALFE